ncbi:MAG: NADH-quinone oxidoreductase subunit NuoE [candidate division Zixibacteria bacterium]|nr:NADH-quinone oxidoreductase subunit NuoE [candidate division Zixibacteria bacterium]NIR62251.1 NADH-quinone oxidoreductase subunit NuoE [candidate division Zixibacteria bacterium]NIS14822.1 NADH-quinone oxidoreductase subunit NuoE [candidate division Zixibacteria bacterium]NIS44487.1 NADH-quinone oxidoreductase subunit NuoE [candidate division Zixibacteria bacterium]NIT51360.1 NADH-quinone oxidoreductase subunit NuoE [candidate division Zixibacteria bacterium]
MALSTESIDAIRKAAARYPHKKSAILPALTIAYRQIGYLYDDLYIEVADAIGVSPNEVASAATFYTMFPKQKVGKYLIQVCTNISCGLMGAESLKEYLLKKLNVKEGGISEDGLFTVVSVECLGSCTTAPMMQVNQTYYENLTREKVDEILNDLREKG